MAVQRYEPDPEPMIVSQVGSQAGPGDRSQQRARREALAAEATQGGTAEPRDHHIGSARSFSGTPPQHSTPNAGQLPELWACPCRCQKACKADAVPLQFRHVIEVDRVCVYTSSRHRREPIQVGQS
jgi:hypothetical protein